MVLASQAQIDLARAELDHLQVKGKAPTTGYSPDDFLPGGRWPSTGHGCTVRDQVEVRDGFDLAFGKRSCHPVAGKVHDPYSGQVIDLHQAQADHVVARRAAYVTGASPQSFTPSQQWPTVQALQEAIGRDPDNLLMVSGRLNAQKRDADIATWEPPNKAYRCSYAVKIVVIKARYGLWATPAEYQQLRRRIAACPATSASRADAGGSGR